MATIAPVGSLHQVQSLTRPSKPVIPNFLRPAYAATPVIAPPPPIAPPAPVAPLPVAPPPVMPLPIAPLPELTPPSVVSRPTPPLPRPRPERPSVAPDTFKPQTLVALPGVRPGQTFQVRQGHYDGYDFGGTAQVLANDGKTLALRVKAQVFFVSATVDLKLELQPDGTALFSAVKHGDAAAQGATTLTVKSQKPGEVVLAGADGSLVKVQATPDGGLALSFGQNHVLLGR